MKREPLFSRTDGWVLVLAVLIGIAVGLFPLFAGCTAPSTPLTNNVIVSERWGMQHDEGGPRAFVEGTEV